MREATAAAAANPRPAARASGWRRARRDGAEAVLAAVLLYLAAGFSLQSVRVIGDSMNPTLETRDLLIASKLDYRLHDPARGDIVILESPTDPSHDYIKRVVGLPGDHVLVRQHTVLVNGRRLTEPYLGNWSTGPDWPAGPGPVEGEAVPAGMYFVLGDNRNHSSDSRLFGWVRRDQIDAHAVLRIWPPAHAGLLNSGTALARG